MIVSLNINAQISIENQITMPTTQVWNSIKFGQATPNLYNGTISVGVPFYTYKDNDFEVPISYIYSSNGYKPNEKPGSLGLGWTLNVGGCITREINGLPDEFYGGVGIPWYTAPYFNDSATFVSTAYETAYGFLETRKYSSIQNSTNFKTGFWRGGENLLHYGNGTLPNSCFYDTAPDIFHFNFLGYSGSFYFWYNNQTVVYSTNSYDGEYKIEFNNDLSALYITTGNGYKYTFGKESPSGSLYVECEWNVQLPDLDRRITWQLTKIQAPNGNYLTFNYSRVNEIGQNVIITSSPVSHNSYKEYVGNNESGFTGSLGNGISDSNPIYYSQLISIVNNNGLSINFDYYTKSEIDAALGRTTDLESYPILKQISVNHNVNGQLKKSILTYSSSTNTNGGVVPFLTNINISGEGNYQMSYIGRTSEVFKFNGTYDIDHWGYYNGKNVSATNFANSTIFAMDASYNETVNQTYRDPDYLYSRIGMLDKITYPTGGYSTFQYEANTYSKIVKRNSSSNFNPFLDSLTSNALAGGVRVSSISNYDQNNTLLNTKTYSYTNEYNNLSSGTMLGFPRYRVEYRGIEGPYAVDREYISTSDVYAYGAGPIGYSRVLETHSDGSKVSYRFSDYKMVPNSFYGGYTSIVADRFYNTNMGILATYVQNILTPSTSADKFRGKLIRKDIYNSTNVLLKRELNYFSQNNYECQLFPVFKGELAQRIGINYGKCLELRNSETTYSSGASVSKNIYKVYNQYGQLIQESSLDSKGDSLISRYIYVTDLPTNQITTGSVYRTMLDSNIIGYPIRTEVYLKKQGASEILISGKRYTYLTPVSTNKRIIKVSKIEVYDSENSSWYTDIEYTSFDNKGNILESKDRNGLYSCYVWGYNGLYLVAKVEGGLSLNNLKSAISGLSNISTSPLTGAMISGAQNTLKTSWPGAKMTVFEYIPFVGLTKITDPSGKVTEYQYNANGKLKNQKDGIGTLHKEYFYSPDNKL